MESNSLVIDLKPDWSELDKISDLLEKFLNDPSFNRDDFDALKMVVTELVENGIKYGYFQTPESTFQLSLRKKKKPDSNRSKKPNQRFGARTFTKARC